ncbi:MAG: extracellular solute-binding protein [Dehalococcoidia bacterium]
MGLRRLGRFRASVAVLATAGLLLSACGGDDATDADATDDEVTDDDATNDAPAADGLAAELGFDDGVAWSFLEDFSDVELNVMIHPSFYEGVGGDDGLFAEFEELSGARINVVTAPAGESYERQMIEWQAESPTFDVVFPIYWDTHPGYIEHLEPLDDYIAAAPDEWDFEGIIPGVQEYLVWDGENKAILFRWGIEGYVYRADLFEEAGIDPPTTYDELVAAAEAVHEETGRHGWTMRGIGHEMVQDWLSLYATTGGTLYADDGVTCAVDTPEGVDVLETVTRWVDEGVLPPDTLAVARDDSVALIQQDRSAQGFFFGGRWPLLSGEDAEDVVRENLAWPDVHPGELSRNTPQSVAIARYSENKDASWAFIEYLLHPKNTPRHVLEWSGTLNRTTDFDVPEVQEDFAIYEYFLDAADTSYVEPSNEQGNQIFDIMNEELTAAILGNKSAGEALESACDRIDSL